MKKIAAMSLTILVVIVVVFFLINSSHKSPPPLTSHNLKKVREENFFSSSTVTAPHENFFSRKTTDATLKLEKNWAQMVDKIEGFLDSQIYYPLSVYSFDLAAVLIDPYINFLKKGFKNFYSFYVSLTTGLTHDEVLKKLNYADGKIFKTMPGLVIKYNEKVRKKELSYYFLLKKYAPVSEEGKRFVVYLVKGLTVSYLDDKVDKFLKASKLLENRKIVQKMPFIALPVAYKIELYYIADEIANFFEREGVEK